MTENHTPGPWHTGGAGKVIIYAEDGFAVANAAIYHGRQEPGESQANAILIAAAPDLLAALEDLRNLPDRDGTLEVDIARRNIKHAACKAIAKAKGLCYFEKC